LTETVDGFDAGSEFGAASSEAALYLALVIVGGWMLFANRARIWKRLTGRAT
jgi:small basic protein